MTPLLHLSHIKKSYGNTTVIDDLSLDVQPGEFVSLLGPSGCGKSTILKLIAGFIEASGGEIHLNGERIDAKPCQKRGAVMVFQNYALFPHMKVSDNIAFGLRMQRRPKAEITRRVDRVLELTRLTGLGPRYPRELSGGQQQRVALARAIILDPQLLLLDEPLSNLDAKLRKDLRAEFAEIHRISSVTTLFVTHDLDEAFGLSDRIAVMNRGRLEQYGAPSDIFLQPATDFVADFVGHRNVVTGVVMDHPGLGPTLPLGNAGQNMRCPGPCGRTARVAIPGHLIRVSSAPTRQESCFSARIMSLQYQGSRQTFIADIDGFNLHGEVVATGAALALRLGDPIFVSWNQADLIVLAKPDG